MTGPAPAGVDEIGIAPVGLADRAAQAALVRRREDQMHVIGHQTVSPHLDAMPVSLLGQQVAIDLLIAIFKKDRFAAIATLGHVMRTAGNDNASQTSHSLRIA